MIELNWLDSGQQLSAKEIEDAQARLNIRFPEDYSEFISRHAGANNPSRCVFSYYEPESRRWFGGNFGTLMGFDDADVDSVFRAMEDFGHRLPEGLIPIIDTGSGGYVCLDYRVGAEPSIVLFTGGFGGAGCVLSVSDSFTEFLRNLTELDDL